jgi:CHAD domain-containing protein
LNRAAGKVKRRSRHAGRLSASKRHALRKSLKKLCFDVETLAGLYTPRAVRTYSSRCEALEKILGLANDAVMTKRMAVSLVSVNRRDLAKPAAALTRWSKRRGRKALQGLKAALKEFREAPAFWS